MSPTEPVALFLVGRNEGGESDFVAAETIHNSFESCGLLSHSSQTRRGFRPAERHAAIVDFSLVKLLKCHTYC